MKDRLQADADMRDRAYNPMPDADAHDRAVARVISMLNEIVERARYPRSEPTPATPARQSGRDLPRPTHQINFSSRHMRSKW